VLDLGATVCRKSEPRCGACPLAEACAWRAAGGPDPAIGSAGTGSRQSRFPGSDRQGRGRLVSALVAGAVPAEALPTACGWPGDRDRAAAVAASVVADGLARWDGQVLRLP
jgi:A/G-specific adenine glycosylase